MTKQPKFPLIHYEDLPRVRDFHARKLYQDQNREFWLDLIKDFLRLCKRILKPICLPILLWGKRGLKRLSVALKRIRKGNYTFTIRIKWCLLGLLLLIAFHPHAKVIADPVRPPTDHFRKVTQMAKKIPESKLVKQEEVQPIEVKPVAPVVVPVSYPDSCSDAKSCIYSKESGNNPNARNSNNCYGIGQDCNGAVERECGANYACQDAFFTRYMQSRYGTWEHAWAVWQSQHWW